MLFETRARVFLQVGRVYARQRGPHDDSDEWSEGGRERDFDRIT
jgi:hypothetical protein